MYNWLVNQEDVLVFYANIINNTNLSFVSGTAGLAFGYPFDTIKVIHSKISYA